jgi:GMP synthase (glutamine-hydrolysing)
VKNALVVRHVHFEDLGAFAAVFDRRGYRVSYLDAGADDFPTDATDGVDLLVILGGPVAAYEDDLYAFLRDELDLIRNALTKRRPLLGVCLGAQLIARALGARVYPSPAKEIGWSPLELTVAGRQGPTKLLDGVAVLHWHGDTFDLPEGAVRLALTVNCANQAFSIGGRVLALQFHPETTEAGFERWLIGHAYEIAHTPGVSVVDLRRQARDFASSAAEKGQACLEAWLSEVDSATEVEMSKHRDVEALRPRRL